MIHRRRSSAKTNNGKGTRLSKPEETIEAVERAHITRVWIDNAQNATKCAQILGMARTTLYRKLRKYGLTRRWVASEAEAG